MKNVAWKLLQALFSFQRILCKNNSKEVSMLIWTYFDCFAYIYNISSLLQKFHFQEEIVLNSLQTQEGLELGFRLQFL